MQDDPGIDAAKKAYKQAWNNAQAEVGLGAHF
jgi:hypothetical protein